MAGYPTFADMQVREDDLYVVYVSTNDTASPVDTSAIVAASTQTMLGQLDNIQFGSQADNRHYPRVSTGAVDKAGDVQHQVTMRLYVDSDLKETARILGVKKPGTEGTAAWGTATLIRLDTTEILQVRVDGYNDTTGTGTVQHTWYMADFSPRSMQTGIQSNNPHLIEVRGIASDVYADPSP